MTVKTGKRTGLVTWDLYDGTVELGFDPLKHVYTANDEQVAGVTTALSIINKPALIPWAVKETVEHIRNNLVPGEGLDELQINALLHEAKNARFKKSDGAKDAGTMIHNWIEDYLKGEEPELPVNETLNRAIKGFLKFWKQIEDKTEIVHIERPLCSMKYKYAGTPDLIARIDGKLTIVDWKSGSGIYPEHFVQMGGYAVAYEEEFKEEINQLVVANCSVKAKFGVKAEDNVELMKNTYLRALGLFKAMKELEA